MDKREGPKQVHEIYRREGPEVTQMACKRCHGIGAPRPDGSIGTCSACHMDHRFCVAEARNPATCGRCHIGPDHPQIEVYQNSMHGIAFAMRSGEMKLHAPSGRVSTSSMPVPTCATCILLGIVAFSFLDLTATAVIQHRPNGFTVTEWLTSAMGLLAAEAAVLMAVKGVAKDPDGEGAADRSGDGEFVAMVFGGTMLMVALTGLAGFYIHLNGDILSAGRLNLNALLHHTPLLTPLVFAGFALLGMLAALSVESVPVRDTHAPLEQR